MASYNNGFMVKLFFFFFFFFTFATIIPVLLASRDIPAPAPSSYEEDEVYIMEGFGEPAESPENDNDDYELTEQFNDFDPSSAPVYAPAPAPAPEESNMELPPEPEPGFYRDITSCVKVIPEECGQPIVDAIYKNNPVDGFCCQKLVEMGKDCHFKLLKVISLVDKNALHAEEISQRGSQLWSHCVSLV